MKERKVKNNNGWQCFINQEFNIEYRVGLWWISTVNITSNENLTQGSDKPLLDFMIPNQSFTIVLHYATA